jgi:hypothetical protein
VNVLSDLVELLRHLDRQRSPGGQYQGVAAAWTPPLPVDDFALLAVAVDSVRVARRLQNDPHVLAGACEALSVVAKLGSANGNLRGTMAGELGCVQLLVEACDRYPYEQHADLHEPVVQALYYLTLNHQDNAALFAGVRGIPVLIKTMRDPYCIQNAGYQLCACGILENLARWPETHQWLQASGGLHALCDAIGAHPNHDGIRRAAYGALGMLSAQAIRP